MCHQPLKVLPQEVLLSESGELTDLGRSYVPPRVLLEALYVICSTTSQWGDPTEAENLAMEVLIITHHPSVGTRLRGAARARDSSSSDGNVSLRLPQLRLAPVSGPFCSTP